MRKPKLTLHPIGGTRFLWQRDGAGQSWCIHENDDREPVGLHLPADARSGFARAAILRHRGGFALFERDPEAPLGVSRTLHANDAETLRAAYEKRLPRKRTI
jgi:hypothetical protein